MHVVQAFKILLDIILLTHKDSPSLFPWRGGGGGVSLLLPHV